MEFLFLFLEFIRLSSSTERSGWFPKAAHRVEEKLRGLLVEDIGRFKFGILGSMVEGKRIANKTRSSPVDVQSVPEGEFCSGTLYLSL